MPTRILLDENLPYDLISLLERKSYEVFHIKKLGKAGIRNGEVYSLAEEMNAWIITRDSDFQSLEKFLRHRVHVIIVFRERDLKTPVLLERAEAVFSGETVSSSTSRLIIVDSDKVRVLYRNPDEEKTNPTKSEKEYHMHRIGHIEIPSTNIKKSKKFFETVFGWTFTDHPDMNYTLFHTGGHPNGGFELVKKMAKRPQTLVYIEVEDVEAKLKEIKKAKGKIVEKKTDVNGMGWYGIFETPDGCRLALWQSAPKA